MNKIAKILALILALEPAAMAAAPQRVLYQGTLRRSGSLFTGNATFVFRVTDLNGTTQYWTSGSTVVAVNSGLFRYPLGITNTGSDGGFPSVSWASIDPYVEVTVDGTLLVPREPMVSVPYALYNLNIANVNKYGDAMFGPLTMLASSITIVNQISTAAFSLAVTTATDRSVYHLYVATTGNVGIGTTDPSSPGTLYDPGRERKLDVVSSAGLAPRFRSTNESVWLLIDSPVGQFGLLVFMENNSRKWHVGKQNDNTFTFWNPVASDVMLLTQSGNVGIGATSPQGRLEVRPDATTNYSLFVSSQNGNLLLGVDKAGDVYVGPHGHALAAGDLSANPDLLVGGNVIVDGQFISHNGIGSSIAFTSAGDFVIGTSTLVVTQGRVGIGTTGPNGRLEINAPSWTHLVESDNAGGTVKSFFGMRSPPASATSYSDWAINRDPNTGLFGDVNLSHAGITLDSANADSRIRFFTASANNALATEKVRIDKNGNVGIGTTNPGKRLEIRPAEADAYSLFVSSQNGNLLLGVDKAGDVYVGAHGHALAPGDLSVNPDLLVGGNVIVDGQFISHNGIGSSVTFTSAGDFVVGTSTLVVTQGRVGIGTVSPDAQFDVERPAPDLAFTETIRLTNPSSTAGGRNTINWFNSGGNMTSARLYSEVGSAFNASKFFIDVADTGQVLRQRLTIDEDGDLGIKTANPTAALHVVGNAFIDTSGTSAATRHVTLKSGGAQFSWGNYAGNWSPSLMLQGVTAGGAESAANFLFMSALDDTQPARITTTKGLEVYTGAVVSPASAGNLALAADALGRTSVGGAASPPDASRLWVQGAAADNFHLTVSSQNASTRLLVIDKAGNVGIGTTNPGGKLHVSGNIFASGNGNGDLALGNDGVSGGAIGQADVFSRNAKNLQLGTADTTTNIGIFTGGNERMRVTSAGSVGIGTTAPTHRLDVSGGGLIVRSSVTVAEMAAPPVSALDQGAIYFDATANKFRVSENGGAYADLLNQASAGGWTDDGTSVRLTTLGDAVVVGNAATASSMTVTGAVGIGAMGLSAGTLIVRSTSTDAANPVVNVQNNAGTELMRVQQDGNVGVGTASPSEKLHIAGNVQFGATPSLKSTDGGFVLTPSGANTSIGLNLYPSGTATGAQVMMHGAQSTNPNHTRMEIMQDGVDSWFRNQKLGSGSNGAFYFQHDGTSRMSIDASGRIGVGSDPPAARLHVSSGNAAASDTILLVSSGAAAGQELLVVKGDGKVGIGTTNPQAQLQLGNGASGGTLRLFGGNAGNDTYGDIACLGDNCYFDNSYSPGAELFIMYNGNVGIGTGNPGAKLEVSGDIKAANFQNSWTSYSPTTSLGHTGCVGRYIVTGKIVYVQLYVPAQTLSTGAAAWTVSLPLTSASNLPTELVRTIFINSSSTRQTGLVIVGTLASTADVYTGPGLAPWTSAGTGSGLAGTMISYPID